MKYSVVFFVNAAYGGGAERQMLLIRDGLRANGVFCSACVIGRVDDSIVCAERMAEWDYSVHTSKSNYVYYIYNVIKIMNYIYLNNNYILWTWGYKAEFLRILGFFQNCSYFSIRSASYEQMWKWRSILRCGYRGVSGYISNSLLGVRYANDIVPGIAVKSYVIPNALEKRFLNSASHLGQRPVVLKVVMLGNVRFRVKGYDIALAVCRMIQDSGLPIRIEIGGAQYEGETDLRRMIAEAGLTNVVTWVGSIADSLKFLQSGHAFMLLSRYEGMPNALFEAMAVGLPCVASAVGDLSRYSEESKGFKTVPIADADAAFSELCWIWNNWDDAVAMGQRAKRFCQERFSEDRMIGDVMRALKLEPQSANFKVERAI